MKNLLWVRSFHELKVPSFSVWPVMGSLGAFMLTSGGVFWWHQGNGWGVFFAFFLVLGTMGFWWRDMMNEGMGGNHTISFINYLQFGIMMFILSEVCFFASFFWGFFHMCWSPSEELGGVWPPFGFSGIVIDPFSVPLLKTILLLSSGVTVTAAHFYLVLSEKREFFVFGVSYLGATVFLGGLFLFFQLEEYSESLLSFNSSVYGSSFFILTGFHGLHVTIGAMMLFFVFVRYFLSSFSKYDHVGFEGAAWYWHFVDVVWLFLFIFVYWLGAPL